MGAYLLDWLNLLVRWAHVIAGIAWIGASFHYLWLQDKAAADPQAGRERWALEGGGFRWEAYWTWITGFALLTAMYYVDAELYLIDPAVMPLSKAGAIGLGLGYLVAGLAVYEGLCRSALGKHDVALSAALLVFLAAVAWSLGQIFSGRGAFIHYGAVLGTIMAGNVAHVIVPGQRRMSEAIREGRVPDAKDERMGRQRSAHNTHFALPVVFAMISNHYAMAFGHRHAWLVLVLMTVAGVLMRRWFLMRHRHKAPLALLAAAVLCVIAPAFLASPASNNRAESVEFATIQVILDHRCVSCHSRTPTFQGLAEPPKGVALESQEQARKFAQQIHQQSVLSRTMPPGNVTGMTDEERRRIDAWFRAGAGG